VAIGGIKTERDPEFILADAHHQRILSQAHAARGRCGKCIAERQNAQGQEQTEKVLGLHDSHPSVGLRSDGFGCLYKTPFRREVRQKTTGSKQFGPGAIAGSRGQHRCPPLSIRS
jgi:hypothetical protein